MKARTREEASHLAKLMYSAIAPEPTILSNPNRPIWSDEQEEFTRIMTEKINDMKKTISRKQAEKQGIECEIENMYTVIDFITLNMTSFDEK